MVACPDIYPRILPRSRSGAVESELTSRAVRWFRANKLRHARYDWAAVSQEDGFYVLHVYGWRSGVDVHFRRILGETREAARLGLDFALMSLSEVYSG